MNHILPLVVTDPNSNRQSVRLFMTTPSNLGATRLHTARMKRRYAPKYRPLAATFEDRYCKGCGGKLWAFKSAPRGRQCINQGCKHCGELQ